MSEKPIPGQPTRRARYFTPDEANRLLVELVPKMRSIDERIHRARSLTEQLADLDEADAQRPPKLAALERLRTEIEANIDEIHSTGVEVKGLSPALLDFPALMNGQEVLLCWREGEEQVEHWHPMHTGFSGRQKLDTARLGSFEWCN